MSFTKGLHPLTSGCFAYLLPDGGYGWSNAGLITDSGETLLVDTLFDLPLTREMLATMRAAVPAAQHMGILVNTHENGDHTFGNQLVEGARIIASRPTAEAFFHMAPEFLRDVVENYQKYGEAGEYIRRYNGPEFFNFNDIVLTPPTEVFDDELHLRVGNKEVILCNLGPAHTRGDTIVHVPEDKVIYTGDILFSEGTPVVWSGPVSGWVRACERIMDLDVDIVVPGHGPLTDKRGVAAMKEYLQMVESETRRRFDAGMSEEETAYSVTLEEPFKGWSHPERILTAISSLYREFSGRTEPVDVFALFAAVSRWERHWKPQNAAPQNQRGDSAH